MDVAQGRSDIVASDESGAGDSTAKSLRVPTPFIWENESMMVPLGVSESTKAAETVFADRICRESGELDKPCQARCRPSPESRSRETVVDVDEIGRSLGRSSESSDMDMGPPTLPLSAAKHPNGDHLRGEYQNSRNIRRCLIPIPLVFCFSGRSAGAAVQCSATSASVLTCPIVTSACRVHPHRSRGPTPISPHPSLGTCLFDGVFTSTSVRFGFETVLCRSIQQDSGSSSTVAIDISFLNYHIGRA